METPIELNHKKHGPSLKCISHMHSRGWPLSSRWMPPQQGPSAQKTVFISRFSVTGKSSLVKSSSPISGGCCCCWLESCPSPGGLDYVGSSSSSFLFSSFFVRDPPLFSFSSSCDLNQMVFLGEQDPGYGSVCAYAYSSSWEAEYASDDTALATGQYGGGNQTAWSL